MATQNTVSFGNIAGTMIAPDLAAEQLQLQRRQQIADYLRQQALSPIEQQTVTGAGPTRVVPISPLQGLAKMLTAYVGKQNQDEIDQKTLGMNRDLAQRYAQVLGGGQPQTAPPSDSPPPSDAQGSPGPTPQAMGQAIAPQPQGQGQNFGLANLLRGAAVNQVGGDQAGAAYWKQYEPTEATRTAQQGNMDPVEANRIQFLKNTTDPKILAMKQGGMSDAQIYGAVFGEAAKNAEIERKAGNQFVNGLTGASGQVPHMPPNANPVGPIAPNGAIPGGVSSMPGALPVVQATARQTARGGAVGGFHSIQSPDGGTQVVPGDQIAPDSTPSSVKTNNAQTNPDLSLMYPQEMKDAQARLAAAQTPQDVQRAQSDIAGLQREMQRTGVPQGQGTGAKKIAEASGDYLATAPTQIQGLKQSVTGLENAYAALERIGKSGQGVGGAVKLAAVLENLNLPVAKDAVQNFQTLKKFYANAANTAAGSNGSNGSDARLDQFMSGQPNPDTMNLEALKGATRYVLSQHDAGIAERKFVMNAAANDPSKVQAARQAFATQYDPKLFEIRRLPTDEQRKAVSAMSPEKAAQFLELHRSMKGQ